jgi:hypothetical protein
MTTYGLAIVALPAYLRRRGHLTKWELALCTCCILRAGWGGIGLLRVGGWLVGERSRLGVILFRMRWWGLSRLRG